MFIKKCPRLYNSSGSLISVASSRGLVSWGAAQKTANEKLEEKRGNRKRKLSLATLFPYNFAWLEEAINILKPPDNLIQL